MNTLTGTIGYRQNYNMEEEIIQMQKELYKKEDLLQELEEWLKEHKNLYEGNEFQNNAKFCMTVDQVLDKIQELKEKYK